MPAPQEAADAEAGEVSPWQAPPAFLAHALLHFIVLNDLGWSPLVASLRRLSRGWRAATDAALPVLAPRIHSSRHDMGALATRVGGGLRVLRFWVPAIEGESFVDRSYLNEADSLLFSQLAASCTRLCSLEVLRWNRPHAAVLHQLSRLQHLTHLSVNCGLLDRGEEAVLPLPPRLRSLALHSDTTDAVLLLVPALAGQTQLTNLDVEVWRGGGVKHSNVLVAAIVQHLSQLRRLRLVNLPAQELQQLAMLRHLTSLAVCCGGQDDPPEALGLLLAALTAGSTPQGAGSGGTLKALKLQGWGDVPPLHLPSLPLAGVEALDLSAVSVQAGMPKELSCLSGLTSLMMNLDEVYFASVLEHAGDAAVAAIGRRLPFLRRLELLRGMQATESALVELSGLTRLTCLRLDSFNDFGGRSLAAMLPLTDLRSLQLSSITLNDVGLAAALEEAAAEHGDGEARVEQQAAVLLPAVTHLSLRDCHLLSPAGLVSLAAALPSLRLLEHDGYPIVKPRHLEETLRRCPKLQLLRTSWRPEAVPPQIPPPEGEGEALQGEGQAQMQQQLQQRPLQQHRKAEEHQAFCRKWHHWLQHSVVFERGSYAQELFDAAAALAEAGGSA